MSRNPAWSPGVPLPPPPPAAAHRRHSAASPPAWAPPIPPPIPNRAPLAPPIPPPPKGVSSAPQVWIAEPVLPQRGDVDAAALAAEEREELENTRRAIIAGAASMIVHLVLLIMLGLMGATPKEDKYNGVTLEASVVKLDDEINGKAARIDMKKPETIDAGRPIGLPNMTGSPVLLPGAIGMNKVGLTIAPPTFVGTPVGAGGGDGLGDDMPAGDVQAHTRPGDGNGATFFNIPATGRKIAFVVDTSGSMFDNERYLRCRSELIESLRSMKPKQYYYVVLFSDRVFPMPGRRMTEATSGNLYRTIAWLNNADPNGTTEPVPALKQALQQKPDAIFLLTDGSFEDGTLEAVLKLQPSSKKIPIHTIAFEGQDGEAALQRISRTTGGKYRYVP